MKGRATSGPAGTGSGMRACIGPAGAGRSESLSVILRRRGSAAKRRRMTLAASALSLFLLFSSFGIRAVPVRASDTPGYAMSVDLNEYSRLSASSAYYAWRGMVTLTGSIPASQMTADFITCYMDGYILPVFTIERADIPLADSIYTFTAEIDTSLYSEDYHTLTLYCGAPAEGDGSNVLWSVEAYFTQDGNGSILTGCNMRQSATAASALLAVVPKGASVDVLEEVKGQYVSTYGTDLWYHLLYRVSGGTVLDGYILSTFVSIDPISMMRLEADGAVIEPFSPSKKSYSICLPFAASVFSIGSLVRYDAGDTVTVRLNGSEVDAPYTHMPLAAGENSIEVLIIRGSGDSAVTTAYSFSISRIAEATEAEFQAQLALFPESYRQALLYLHSHYPNWLFTAFDTGLEWADAVANEDYGARSLIYRDQAIEYYKYVKTGLPAGAAFNDFIAEDRQDGDSFYTASTAAVEYYLDPRNFLSEQSIYMFEQLTYDPTLHTLAGIADILSGSGLAGLEQQFLDAGAETRVSPYHLAARARQEVTAWNPVGLSPIAGGTYTDDVAGDLYYGLYNFYNIGTGSSTDFGVLYRRGLSFAKGYVGGVSPTYAGTLRSAEDLLKYRMPWDTPAKAITGGAVYIGQSYINMGQDNLYLQKFDVDPINGLYYHQYMQNVQAPYNESRTSYNAYREMGSLDNSFIFRIPVYADMPLLAKPRPENASKLSSLGIDGFRILPAFDPSSGGPYRITVPDTSEEVTVSAAACDSEAVVGGTGAVRLEYGENTLTVTCAPATGQPRTYTLIVTRSLPPKSSDNYLSSLGIGGAAFDRAFYYADFGPYAATVPYETDRIDLAAVPRSELSAVSGAGSIILQPGANDITVTVTAENGISRSYRLTVTRTIPQITSDVYKLFQGSLSGIAMPATVASLKASMGVTAGELKVYDRSGKEISGTDAVGTGTTVRLYYGDKVFDEYRIIIYGDLSGDGKINSTDISILKSHILKLRTISAEYQPAADVNRDGKINSTDFSIIKRHILKIKSISQAF